MNPPLQKGDRRLWRDIRPRRLPVGPVSVAVAWGARKELEARADLHALRVWVCGVRAESSRPAALRVCLGLGSSARDQESRRPETPAAAHYQLNFGLIWKGKLTVEWVITHCDCLFTTTPTIMGVHPPPQGAWRHSPPKDADNNTGVNVQKYLISHNTLYLKFVCI